jgi:hypothetical protein
VIVLTIAQWQISTIRDGTQSILNTAKMEETTMMAERENRAGHAYAAMSHGCRVHKLSLNGFSASDLENRENAKCLDAWTMIEPPRSIRPVGTFQYTHAMEQLMHIAIAGPVVELSHRRLPCVLENVRQFTDDWHQAWTAAGYLYEDETMRLQLLRRRIHNSPAVVVYGLSEFYGIVTHQLLEQGILSIEQLARLIKADVLKLKGTGPKSAEKLEPFWSHRHRYSGADMMGLTGNEPPPDEFQGREGLNQFVETKVYRAIVGFRNVKLATSLDPEGRCRIERTNSMSEVTRQS